MGTGISYVHETLNPIVGCDPSMSCAGFCWARRTVNRLAGKFPVYKTCLSPDGKQWSGNVLWRPKELKKLAHWKKGKRIFMVAQGDLFGPAVQPRQFLDILGRMMVHDQHRYLILTKKSNRLAEWMCRAKGCMLGHIAWGVSIIGPEDMPMLDTLLKLDPALRLWVSFEPLLTPVSHLLTPTMLKRLSWVVIGCLKLPGDKAGGWAMDDSFGWVEEADRIQGLCKEARVACYIKQYPSCGLVWPGYVQEIPDFLTLPWEK